MAHPVETRRGAVQSITLTVPLLSSNSYLVVRLPQQAVRDMLEHVRTLPPDQRPGFVREWIMRNQQAVIEQHIRSGGRQRRFRYDVVPVAAVRLSSTPRRVEGERPPAGGTVPRREETRSPTGGSRRPIQPRVEESRGVSGPAPPAAMRPPTVAPPPAPVEAPAPQLRRRGARSGPQEFEGGRGTASDPYRVNILPGRSTGSDLGAQVVRIPFTFSIGERVRFSVSVTMSQLADSRIQDTYREIIRVCRSVILQHHAQGGTVRLQVPPFAQWRQTVRGQLDDDARLRRYLTTH